MSALLGLLGRASRLEQEPGPPLRLVDPRLQQACGRYVAMIVAEVMRLPQVGSKLLIVIPQFRQHVQGRNEVGIVIQDPLQTAYLADRAQCRATDLANAFGDFVRS